MSETARAVGAPRGAPTLAGWSRATLIAFRFAFVVAALSAFHLIGFVGGYLFFDTARTSFGRWVEPVGNLEFRTARYIGAAAIRLVTGSTGTAQQIAQRYSYPACYLIAVVLFAAALALVWTAADRRRSEYGRLDAWMRQYCRYTLALVMITFAVVKVVPTQFGYLTPGELLRPLGQLNRFWVLWDFMAVSTSYTIFVGLAELLGSVLLFFRRTTLLGTLLLAAALTNVFAMDLAYGVLGPAMVVGLLLALAMILMAPYAAPLVRILVLGLADRMPAEPMTVLSRWRHAPVAKLLVLVVLISVRVSDGLAQRRSYFGSGQAVYGMYDVARFVRGGVPITPTADDPKTWIRVASDGRYGGSGLAVQFSNGDVRRYSLSEDPATRLWTVREEATVIATLTYAVAADGAVSLDGRIGDDPVQLSLRPIDMQTLPLLRR